MIEPADLCAVACPLCGRDDARPVCEKQGFRVVRCKRCRLVYVNPRLTFEALDRMYNAQALSGAPYYLRTAKDDAPSFLKRLHWIAQVRAPGTLLDVGCGPGTFLALAREQGWRASGIDVNAASVVHCHALGLDAIAGPFPHPELAGRNFDAVVLNDVLEHLVDPRQGLVAARDALAPGGVLFISTPDVGSLVARISGNRWLHLKPFEHLTYFDRRNLAQLLDEVGFEVLRVTSIGRNRSLALILDRLATYSGALSKLTSAVIPRGFAERLSVPINPGDEMAVLARRR